MSKSMPRKRLRCFQGGFSFIELLLVIAIFGILAALVLATVSISRQKAYDNRIRSSVSQLRVIAESAYDSHGASYVDWSKDGEALHPSVIRLLEEIDKNFGDPAGAPYVAVFRESQSADYCISAPLRAVSGHYYCVDTTGVFRESASACPDYGDDQSGDPPLRCPAI